MKTYIELTNDRGYAKEVHASNNAATYVLTSARMHDLYSDYIAHYNRVPSSAWYHRHAQFAERR